MRYSALALAGSAASLALAAAAPAAAQDVNPVFTGPRIEATLGTWHHNNVKWDMFDSTKRFGCA